MKKIIGIAILMVLVLMTNVACGGEGAVSSGGNGAEITAADVAGNWVHEDEVLSFYFEEDYTFSDVTNMTNSKEGSFEFIDGKLHLNYDEGTTITGSFDLEEMTLKIDNSVGVYHYKRFETAPNIDDIIEDETLAPIAGFWKSDLLGVNVYFYTNGAYEINSYTGEVEKGIYQVFDDSTFELQGSDGNYRGGNIITPKELIEIGGYLDSFIKGTIDFNNYTPPENGFVIDAIFGNWKSQDESLMFVFNSDMSYDIFYKDGNSAGGSFSYDGEEITFLSDFGTMGDIIYYPSRDSLEISGHINDFVRGEITIVESQSSAVTDNYFIGEWEMDSDNRIEIYDDFSLVFYINGERYDGNYNYKYNEIEITISNGSYSGSYDLIEASIDVDGVGRFYK